MKKVFLTLLLLSSTTQAAPFAKGNADIGKKLFDKNNCNSCHAKMVEGGGDAVFTRAEHKVRNADQLVQQMSMCNANTGTHLSAQDEQDIGAYLNKRFYKFK
ncbi:MAG: cytochrome c [Gallionellaceae bacterium]|nr:cytochrome c [Gallionellaceae bacterium]